MKFEIFERIYSGHYFLSSYNCRGWTFDSPRLGAGNFITKFIGIMDKGVCQYILDVNEFNQAAEYAANRLINDDRWRARMYRKIDYYTKSYFFYGEKLKRLPFFDLSDQEMVREIRRIIPLQHYHQVCSVLVNGMVIDGRNHLSDKIREELKMNIHHDRHFEKYWSLLSLVTKMSLRQKKDYAIASLAKRSRELSSKDLNKKLKLIYSKYHWIDYLYLGPPSSLGQYQQELQSAIKNNIYLHLPFQLRKIKDQQNRLISRLKLNLRSRFLIKFAQYVIWQKGYRKDIQAHGFYCYEPFFQELARRKKAIDWRILTFLFPWEVENFILRNKPDLNELLQRKKYSCLIVDKKSIHLKVGQDAKSFTKKLEFIKSYSHLQEIRGQCAYIGKVLGRVKIIQVPVDMVKMKKGDIIVSQATSPDLLPAMKKAAAIVTNTGGLICHAAITSRELKIPCVVGTGNATQVFKDGDFVEVDATKGVVKRMQ